METLEEKLKMTLIKCLHIAKHQFDLDDFPFDEMEIEIDIDGDKFVMTECRKGPGYWTYQFNNDEDLIILLEKYDVTQYIYVPPTKDDEYDFNLN